MTGRDAAVTQQFPSWSWHCTMLAALSITGALRTQEAKSFPPCTRNQSEGSHIKQRGVAQQEVQCSLLDCCVHIKATSSMCEHVAATSMWALTNKSWRFRNMDCMCDRAAHARSHGSILRPVRWHLQQRTMHAQHQLISLHGSGRAEQYLHCSISGEPPCSTPAQWLN